MKAYYVYCDPNEYDRWSVVVFAESAGQAKRVPKLDKSFRGHTVMEWDLDMQDRIDLYEADVYRCEPEYMEEWLCNECALKDRCKEYREVYCDEQEN